LVSERKFTTLEKDREISIKKRSFYFLEISHVIIFVFFCDKKDIGKISHGESPSAKLTHLLALLHNKMKCCFVLREKDCGNESCRIWKCEGFKYLVRNNVI